MSEIKRIKGILCVSIVWLKSYYDRPSQELKRSPWKQIEAGWIDYNSVVSHAQKNKNKSKYEVLPSYNEVLNSLNFSKQAKTKIANKNAEKLQNWHKAILNSLYINNMPIYNPTHIHRMYEGIVNRTIDTFINQNKVKYNELGKLVAIQDIINSSTGELIIMSGAKVSEPVSLRSVERYLNTKEVQALYNGKRYGTDSAYSSYVPTESVKRKHSLWMMDGYTNNFYINNQYVTCVTYVIVDAADMQILGVATGFKETHELMQKSWRMAIESTGKIPLEVESDGKNIVDYINGYGFNIKLSKRRNKQGSRIEQFFATVQQNHFRKLQGYRGDNIKAKRKGARMNTDINPLDSNSYPLITSEHIHNEWIKLMSVYDKKAEEISGINVEKYHIAKLFGKQSNATIARGFLKVFGQLYEVPAALHLHEKMPNDWRLECATTDEDECHIYNQGLYIATLQRTSKVQRSSFERKELEEDSFGGHMARMKEIEKVLETAAEDRLLSIPDEAQAAMDAAQSPDYWLKEIEIELTNKLSEVKTKEVKDIFDVDDNFIIEVIKTA